MPFVTTHPISGEPLIIESPFTAEHIKVGAFLWYWGYTSVSSWDCPAVITRVNKKRRQFRVRSLDDMREQDQWYSFDCTQASPTSRQTMRVTSAEEVKTFLEKQRQHLVDSVAGVTASEIRAKSSLSQFDRFIKSIILEA